MGHLLSASMPRIAASTNDRARARCERKRSLRGRPTTTLVLALHVVGVAALVAASVTAIADQSARFVSGQEIVGVHEIPSFISDRVELPPGMTSHDSGLEVAPGRSPVR
jgi:hypothetical protein